MNTQSCDRGSCKSCIKLHWSCFCRRSFGRKMGTSHDIDSDYDVNEASQSLDLDIVGTCAR